MLKKIISHLIIFSILLPPEAGAMFPKNREDDEGSQRRSIRIDPKGKRKEVALISSSQGMSTPRRRAEASREGDFSLKDMSLLGKAAINADAEGALLLTQGVHYSHYTEETEEEGNDEHGDGNDKQADERPEDIDAQTTATLSSQDRHGEEAVLLSATASSREDSSFPLVLRVLPQEGDIESLSNLPPHIIALMEKLQEFGNGTPDQQTILRLLERMYDEGNAGKIKNRQFVIAGILGAVIAMGISFGISLIYADDLYLDLLQERPRSANLFSQVISLFGNDIINSYFTWIIFFDGIVRNSKSLMHLMAPSLKEFEVPKSYVRASLLKSINGLFYFSGGVVGTLLIYYILFGDNPLKRNNQAFLLSLLCPLTFLLDDAIFFGSRLSQQLNSFFNSALRALSKDKLVEEREKHALLENLKTFKRYIFDCSSTDLVALSQKLEKSILGEGVFSQEAKVKKATALIQNLQEIIKFDQPPSRTSHLSKNELFKEFVNTGSVFMSLIATFGRSVVFWYILDEVFKGANPLLRIILSTVIGGGIASLVQFKFEADSVRDLILSLSELQLEELNPLRAPKKVFFRTLRLLQENGFALLITFPFTLTGIFATEGWPIAFRLICLVPSTLTTFIGNAMAFHEVTEDFSTFLKDLDFTTNPNIVSQNKRILIFLIQKYERFIQSLRPDLWEHLHLLLSLPTINHSNEDFVHPSLLVFSQKARDIVNLTTPYSPNLRSFLRYVHKSLAQDKVTFRQALGATLGGVAIASMSLNSLSSLYWGSIFNDIYQIEYFTYSTDPLTTYIIANSGGTCFYYNAYTNCPIEDAVSVLFFNYIEPLDSLRRSVSVLSRFLKPSADFWLSTKKIQSIASTLGYGGAILACTLFAHAYLDHQLLERIVSNNRHHTTWYLVQFGYNCPFLLLNSLFFFGPVASERLEHILKGVTSYFVPKSIPTVTDRKRRRWVKEFEDLRHWFARLPDSAVHEVYDQVLEPQHTAYKQEEVEQVSIAEALKTLWVMRQLHQQNALAEREMSGDYFRKGAATTTGWTLAILARFGSSVIYWHVFSQLFELMGLENEYAKMSLSVVLGGVIASLTQGLTEITAGENVAYDLMNGSEVCQDTSKGFVRKSLRRLGKTYNYGLASLYSLPYLAFGVLATQNWNLWLRCAALIPAGLGELIRNKFMLDQSLGSAALFVDRVNAKLTYPSATQKRNALVRVADNYKRAFERLHPDVVEDLDKILADINLNPPHAEATELDDE